MSESRTEAELVNEKKKKKENYIILESKKTLQKIRRHVIRMKDPA